MVNKNTIMNKNIKTRAIYLTKDKEMSKNISKGEGKSQNQKNVYKSLAIDPLFLQIIII